MSPGSPLKEWGNRDDEGREETPSISSSMQYPPFALSSFLKTPWATILCATALVGLCLGVNASSSRSTEAAGEQGVRAASSARLNSAPATHVRLVATEETVTAWFRLDAAGQPQAPDQAPLGVARWISGPVDGERPQDGRRVELEVRWIGEDVRLLVSERILPREHRVIWREQLPKGGRTVLISVDRDDPTALLDVSETANGKVRRRRLPRDGGAWQLLSLVEAAAQGVEPHGSARILMPQKAAIESVRLSMTTLAGDQREVALTFAGGLAGPRFTFEGRELVGFTWQAGGPVATRIPWQEHTRWIRHGSGKR